ncbi:uncharacterized protein LOC108212650 [Daucus carota subsp. sativus]|uniref:uncharacterized protein LOC108212650 n=1 Tax=Daucus carota subsp. sativus TaxID=79200 RepID=UPI0007EFBA3C|nr:PREDICTED: uncharacterized protein LOC108212650 [Daucus carota subsp. sativus]
MLNVSTLKISVADRKMLALEAVDDLLKQYGKKLSDYPGMPLVDRATTNRNRNDLLIEEMMYDQVTFKVRVENIIRSLNNMQGIIFHKVLNSVDLKIGGLYFVYGPGGTGKTFLWSAIISKLRSQGRIVLTVASSGIASLLIDGVRRAHSRFKIPLHIDEFSCCKIKQNTYLAELIC